MLKTKEELVLNYWLNEMRARQAERMRKQIEKLETDKMHDPMRTLGIVNEDGQLEVIVAKEVPEEVKLLPDVIIVMIGLVYIFTQLEIRVGSLL